MSSKTKNKHHHEPVPVKKKSQLPLIIGAIAGFCIIIAIHFILRKPDTVSAEQHIAQPAKAALVETKNKWIERGINFVTAVLTSTGFHISKG